MVLTSNLVALEDAAVPILCPLLGGLTAGQADCAIVMPTGNANDLLLAALEDCPSERLEAGLHVGVLCADPFVQAEQMLAELAEKGVHGVVNWPSSIFFEGRTREVMAALPAQPEQEFRWLAKAREVGLEASAVILSRDHGLFALEAGIGRLIIHPGLPHSLEPGSGARLADSLAQLIAALRGADAAAELLLYRHPALGGQRLYDNSGADGFVDYGVSP